MSKRKVITNDTILDELNLSNTSSESLSNTSSESNLTESLLPEQHDDEPSSSFAVNGDEENSSNHKHNHHHHPNEGSSDEGSSCEVLPNNSTSTNTDITTGLIRGRLMLLFVSVLYGSLTVSYRLLYHLDGPPSPSILNMTRGWMVTVWFFPIVLYQKRRHSRNDDPGEATSSGSPSRSMWKAALELSILNVVSLILASLSLTIISSARSAFFGQLTVVMVPLLSSFMGETVTRKTVTGCAASIIGIVVLSLDGESSSSSGASIWFGDLLNVCSTLVWSCVIIRTSQIGMLYDEVGLQGTKNFFSAILYTVVVVVFAIVNWRDGGSGDARGLDWLGWRNPIAWVVLGYSALGPGCIADLLQQKGQGLVSASECSLYLALEPVFAIILGQLLLGEQSSWLELLGGACIVLGALVASQ